MHTLKMAQNLLAVGYLDNCEVRALSGGEFMLVTYAHDNPKLARYVLTDDNHKINSFPSQDYAVGVAKEIGFSENQITICT
ncbi:hypothetical protein [Pleionea sp. CnH1-48]|uniref:hypothetical protein n=1 Tax=Pleionea sp. CnH1-48 TaxID=2954494 RepID=UPI0020982190|nr:hypothetical protein [Pleionea sp. CnH1-48]MCO7226168.1 hypothetical protein [Pleionea sp. CnH1-48]